MESVTATPGTATAAIDDGVVGESRVEEVSAGGAVGDKAGEGGNGHHLSVSTPEKAGMSEELKDIFNKLIDEQGHLDMRNVTTLIWVNRKRPDIVETIVELLIENSNERRVFNGIEFYLPQLAHMIVHLDVHLPSSALEQFALVVCQQSLHVALQLNWILVAALEDYHAETPGGSRNKKANTVYFNRCAKLLQNVERIIALGAPSAADLEELYATGQLSRHEVDCRTIADRKRQAEKVISSPKKDMVPVTEEIRIKGWLWHKRWHKRGFPHHSRWIRRWFMVEDRVLYCYNAQEPKGSKVKRAAVLYQASVKVCDYKDGQYPHYFEVHSPMGSMRLRAEDAAGKEAWVSSLQKQAQAMPAVAHLYAHNGPPSAAGVNSTATAGARSSAMVGGELPRPSNFSGITEESESQGGDGGVGEKKATVLEPAASTSRDTGLVGGAAAVEVREAASKLLAGTVDARRNVMDMSSVVLQEAKRNKRFQFFNEERKFVSDMTDICETLRFLEDRSKRGEMLESLLMEVNIPECGYLPLCRSTEPFQRVLKITSNEAKAFSTKERVPAMVTFETEMTWAPGTRSSTSPPLDVASFLHFVYGFHAPMHQNQQRYSSIALRGGEDSIMEPDLLAVTSEAPPGDETPSGGARVSRSGSFRFRGGAKPLTFHHPVHLPSNLASVWREKPAGGDSAKAKEARGSKSPFRHNLSSLSSALHARATSMRHVLPGKRQSFSRRGGGHTPGSAVNLSSTGRGEEREVGFFGVTGEAGAVALPDEGKGHSAAVPTSGKNVAFGDCGKAEEEKEKEKENATSRDVLFTTPEDATAVKAGEMGYSGEGKEEESQGGLNDGIADLPKPSTSGRGAVVADDAGLDKALKTKATISPISPADHSRCGSAFTAGTLDDVTLDHEGEGRGIIEEVEEEEEEPRTPCKAYGESMVKKAKRIRKQSLEGGRSGWALQRLIMKSNDDVRQEVFVMQLIIFYKEVFEREGLDLWLKPYSILSTAKTTGLIEVLEQATSMDGLKKSQGYAGSLVEHFYAVFGPEGSDGFKAAQRRFMCSLAGYSVVSYLLRIKDRHNGNVMLDADGHIVHIDFGFVLGSAPGNAFSMERAAFKLTAEYMAVLGGKGSPLYEEFADLFAKGLAAARKYASVTITMIEIMMFQSEFPCFEYMGDAALKGFKKRLMLGAKDSDVTRRARRMVDKANGHWGTCFYDKFQLWTNGILP